MAKFPVTNQRDVEHYISLSAGYWSDKTSVENKSR